MRQCAYNVAHVFANRGGSKTCGNCSCFGKNYYSYSTVFGQWVDENTVLIYTGKTSNSSSQHQLYKSVFPDWVNVFEYSDGRRYYSGCDLIGYKSVWDVNDRMRLIDYYFKTLYYKFDEIKNAPKKHSARFGFQEWDDALSLCELYKDTSVKKWLKIKGRNDKFWRLVKRMVRALMDGCNTVKQVFIRMYGEAAWKEYYDFCEKFRKADRQKERTQKIAKYLGVGDPYDKHSKYHLLSPEQIRKLTAAERLHYKFEVLRLKEVDVSYEERYEKERQSYKNFYKWVTGHQIEYSRYGLYGFTRSLDDKVHKCRNMFNGEEYNIERVDAHAYNWDFKSTVILSKTEFAQYKNTENKEAWLREFYSEVKEAAFNVKAQNILESHKAGTGDLFERVYQMTDELAASMTAEELAIVSEYIRKQDKYYADKDARERAEKIRRQREAEERRKEKELQEKLKNEQIEACVLRGIEGARDLWKLHYMSDTSAMSRAKVNPSEFYDGGNVLLRFNLDKTIVETSMGIRIDVSTCKKLFRIIKVWHEHPEKFSPRKVQTHFSGEYTIVSYKNDILTAGCHKIAYTEMERMYDSIMSLEKVA